MRRLVARLLFLAALAGTLLWWSQSRRPRDLQLAVDLTAMLPGEITEVDVVVRRGGRALARHDVQYGPSGAPAMVELIVHAPPGEAEVETTLAYGRKAARKSVARVKLSADTAARVRAE
jgi:hypothetical protein